MQLLSLILQMTCMLNDQFKTDYQKTVKECDFTLFRHPVRSMADRLQATVPLAKEYPEADNYGTGLLVEKFEQQVAKLLGQPEALFLPSGTMAQLIALRIWSDQKNNKKIGFHATSHLQLHEQMAYAELHQLQSVLIGQPDQVITIADLNKTKLDLAALLIELPMREIGGQLPSWEDLLAQSLWAKQNQVGLHLDGARVWSCETYYQKNLTEIAGLFDSVYVSFYKDLDGISGAVLAGSKTFIDSARIWLRRCGGNLVSVFPEILAAKVGLEKNLPLMPKFVAKSRIIAKYINQQTNLRTIPQIPPCNLFHLLVEQSAETLMPKVKQWSKKNNIALLPLPRQEGDDFCRFEITIGQNALVLSEQRWLQAIESFSDFIR